MRDACEYFKDAFFNDIPIEESIYNYLNSSQLSKEEAILFLARMIYPSFYFDIYEEIIHGSIDEKALESVIFKIINYEKLIKKIYNYLKRYYDFPNIEWLNT
jgi:hypothetical protein